MLKLHALGEPHSSEATLDEAILDMSRALYKVHLQLLLLINAINKMLGVLMGAAKTTQIQDLSSEIASIRVALSRALEESTESERGTPTPTPSPSPLPGANNAVEEFARVADLLKSARWSSALEAVRLHRAQWPGDPFHDDDDITTALNMYCRHLGQERSGLFILIILLREFEEILILLFFFFGAMVLS